MQQLVRSGMHLPIKLPATPQTSNQQNENEENLAGSSLNRFEPIVDDLDRDPLSLSFSDTADESELEFTKNMETESTTSPSVSTWRNETSV